MSDNSFKIFKYVLDNTKEQVVEMPPSAQILEVEFQPGDGTVQLCLWALVMPSQPKVNRRVVMLDTGEEIPPEVIERYSHIKTIQMLTPRVDEEGGLVPKAIVFHLFLERGVVN